MMIKKALASAQVTIEIPFHDVDMMQIVWHGHYVKYFEIARCVLLDQIGYNYLHMAASGFSWPVVDMAVRFLKPARFGQRICIEASVIEYEHRLKINYLITDEQTGTRLTKGHTIQVAVDLEKKEMCLVSPVVLVEKLGVQDNEI